MMRWLVMVLMLISLSGYDCEADPVTEYPVENTQLVNTCLLVVEANMPKEVMDFSVLGIAYVGFTDDIAIIYSIALTLEYRDLTENHRIVYCAENYVGARGTDKSLKSLLSRLHGAYGARI